MTLEDFVRQIAPDLDADKQVIGTNNSDKWFKIIGKTLYVPPINKMMYSSVFINHFIECMNSLQHFDSDNMLYQWYNLNSFVAYNEEDALWVIEILKAYDVVSADIETKYLEYDDNKILAIGFCVDPTTAYGIAYFNSRIIEELGAWMRSGKTKFIWQNGKFDIRVIRHIWGIPAVVDEDTMLLHFVGINCSSGTHDLKQMAQTYLNAPAWEDELNNYKKQWCTKNKVKLADFTYDMVPANVLIPYMLKDCIATYRLFMIFDKIARPESRFIYRKLIHASNVFCEIEMNGVTVDVDYLSELADILCTEYEAADRAFRDEVEKYWDRKRYLIETGAKSAPEEFNMSSPKQLKWILEEVTGQRLKDTSKDTLDDLSADNDFIKNFQKIRQLSKLIDTYIEGINKQINIDGKIRGSYKLHGAETGRLSCEKPNMQNIPREKRIKNLFIASAGYRLVQLDYSQAELRVLAMLSGDKTMSDIYKNDKDIHAYTAEKLFGPDFTKEQRTLAKPVNFGIAYGLTPVALSKDIGVSRESATRFIADWFRAYPQAHRFINKKRMEPLKGIGSTTPFGRERTYYVTNVNMYHVQNEAINTPIQSIASDLTLLSLLEIDEYLKEKGIDARIIITVHDSIILEVVDDLAVIKEVIDVSKNIMAEIPKKYLVDCDIPFKADASIGYKWGELEDV